MQSNLIVHRIVIAMYLFLWILYVVLHSTTKCIQLCNITASVFGFQLVKNFFRLIKTNVIEQHVKRNVKIVST